MANGGRVNIGTSGSRTLTPLPVPVIEKCAERVVAYVDHLGRLEGKIARTFENGFAMSISATLRKRDKLAAQLTWLANRQILNLPEDRRHGRFAPRNPMARLVLPNGTNVACRVIDLSQSDAAIGVSSALRPPIGVVVTVGKTQGRVVRHIEDGFAIEFMRLRHPDFVEENVTGEIASLRRKCDAPNYALAVTCC